jgi:hypothetical protein
MNLLGESMALVEMASTELLFVAVLENSHAGPQQLLNYGSQGDIRPQRRIKNRIERGFAEQLLQARSAVG